MTTPNVEVVPKKPAGRVFDARHSRSRKPRWRTDAERQHWPKLLGDPVQAGQIAAVRLLAWAVYHRAVADLDHPDYVLPAAAWLLEEGHVPARRIAPVIVAAVERVLHGRPKHFKRPRRPSPQHAAALCDLLARHGLRQPLI